MPKPDFSQPINRADAEARRAFRELLARDGKDALAAKLEANPRTIERIGLTRDVPPGMAMDIAEQLTPVTAGSIEGRWFAAFSIWAEDCRQRTEARRG
ncbi:hypothetical protein [Novosphingobium sp. ST904]|uniref:hypothetical protein n=1 Tax=Novosphingobium sp. ST904 TaxID=1684385 RepID=UPI0006C88E73|nr:hypothetical protein [Novosphingobium sp. ST904]KPH59160.1 hypothetical protein ADT71_23740 [Novosphingobium sp. ST904]TCM37757.1 hypothetical protein EDF59_110153 [Novosphingobium sp. ST904]